MPKSHKLIYGIYVMVWIIMAIHPKYPEDWLLENLLVFLFFPFLVWMDFKHHFSVVALSMLLVFASLHSLGSHFTYAEMEYFDVITKWMGFERNHFDRVVHFLFGLLVFRTLFELVAIKIETFKAAMFFTFTIVLSISTLYEIIEWLAAIIFHPELGIAFLGTQGDVWDSQKDTIAAFSGALFNILFYRTYKDIYHKKLDR
jgi:putative membrane protein